MAPGPDPERQPARVVARRGFVGRIPVDPVPVPSPARDEYMASVALCSRRSAVAPGSWKAMPMLAVTGCLAPHHLRPADRLQYLLGQSPGPGGTADPLGQDEEARRRSHG